MDEQITVVKSAGFCFGVQKAVSGVYDMLQGGENIAILGELIHNPIVNADLKRHAESTKLLHLNYSEKYKRFLKKKQPPSIHALLMVLQNNMVSGLQKTIVKVMVCLP